MATATLSSKGRITIPLPVREKLGLKAGRPNRIPFEELMGALKSPRQRVVTARQMDQGIERAVRERRPDPTLPGVVALCPTRRACEQELRSTFEEWLVLGLKLGHALPLIGGIDLNHGPAREPVDTL